MATKRDPAAPWRVVIAPDSFKGTVSASDAAQAISDGWRRARPRDELLLRPMADGGEGTLDALAAARDDAQWMSTHVTGPDGRPVQAEWLRFADGSAAIELARASGITLMRALDPFGATSLGFGQLVAAALDAGATGVLLCIGGSASTDGGIGLLVGLGAHVEDASGRVVAPTNLGAGAAALADFTQMRRLPVGGAVVLSDVTNPLLGERGAAAVFGPQKGADAAQVEQLESNLVDWAGVVGAPHLATSAGAGAAGGVGFGTLVWGARMQSGARAVADAIGLDEAVDSADVVVTGEGRYDAQSHSGKVVGDVLERAAARGCATVVIAGEIALARASAGEEFDPRRVPGFAWAQQLVDVDGGRERALAEPIAALHWAAYQSALGLSHG